MEKIYYQLFLFLASNYTIIYFHWPCYCTVYVISMSVKVCDLVSWRESVKTLYCLFIFVYQYKKMVILAWNTYLNFLFLSLFFLATLSSTTSQKSLILTQAMSLLLSPENCKIVTSYVGFIIIKTRGWNQMLRKGN